ncbi:MAG: hypothetical protein U0414_19870 [Polyangiaceae bacterium]
MDLTPAHPLHRDRFYSPIQEAVAAILQSSDVVRPIDVLVHLEVITPELVDRWRSGGVPYLERGMTSGLAKVARMLTVLEGHARELGLEPVPGKYVRRASKTKLRFSKSGEPECEAAYGRHYRSRSSVRALEEREVSAHPPSGAPSSSTPRQATLARNGSALAPCSADADTRSSS